MGDVVMELSFPILMGVVEFSHPKIIEMLIP